MINRFHTTLSLLVGILVFSQCQHTAEEQGQAILNLSALAAFPLEQPITAYAQSDTFIQVSLPKNARIEELSAADLAKLKAAAYRFYKHVKLVDGHYQVSLPSGKEIAVDEEVVSAYKKAIDQVNQYADSLKAEGQEIRLPEITESYRQHLIK